MQYHEFLFHCESGLDARRRNEARTSERISYSMYGTCSKSKKFFPDNQSKHSLGSKFVLGLSKIAEAAGRFEAGFSETASKQLAHAASLVKNRLRPTEIDFLVRVTSAPAWIFSAASKYFIVRRMQIVFSNDEAPESGKSGI